MSDLVLLLSEKESFGLTLLEAMKTGVVPIGSTAGGIKEVLNIRKLALWLISATANVQASMQFSY